MALEGETGIYEIFEISIATLFFVFFFSMILLYSDSQRITAISFSQEIANSASFIDSQNAELRFTTPQNFNTRTEQNNIMVNFGRGNTIRKSYIGSEISIQSEGNTLILSGDLN